MRTLDRTRFALDEIKSFCISAEASPLIQSYFSNYLSVLFYAEVEQIVRNILEDRLSQINDKKVSMFINHGSGKLFARVKKNEINDLLKMFGCGDGDLLSQYVDDSEVQRYSAIILDRHLTSHGNGSNVTIPQIEAAVPCAEKIFAAFEQIIT